MATKTKKQPSSKTAKKKFPWRTVEDRWTNTIFCEKLLKNPSLMTNEELAAALFEHNSWRRSMGKYDWKHNPIAEGAEQEPPFSSEVIGRFVDEACARLLIIHDLTVGRNKKSA